MRLIDLSQEIFQGMSVFPMHQPTFIMTNMTHEENMKQTGSKKTWLFSKKPAHKRAWRNTQ